MSTSLPKTASPSLPDPRTELNSGLDNGPGAGLAGADEEVRIPTPKPLRHSTKSGPRTVSSPEKVYDALNAAKTADDVQITLKSSRAIQGSLVFNPLKGSVRIIDIEKETSEDFSIKEIAELKFL